MSYFRKIVVCVFNSLPEHGTQISKSMSQGIPVVVEACGGSWGPQAQKLWSEIAKATAQATGELEATVAARIYQNLGFILHRENARAIVREIISDGQQEQNQINQKYTAVP